MAVLTKGPVGLAFPAIIFGIYLVATRSLSELKRKEVWLGLVVCCFVSIPWYAAMYKVHGMAFIETFLGFHNITRFTSPEHPETAGWYFFIPVLLLGFFPWSVFMLRAVKDVIKRQFHEKTADHRLIFFLIWAIFILLFFSASKTKLVSYILPMFPPLALLTGYYLDRLCQQREAYNMRWISIVHVLFVLLLAGGLFYAAQAYPEIRSGSMMAATVLLGMAGSFYWLYRRYGIKGVVGIQAFGMLLFANIFAYSMVPAVEARLGCRDFGQSLRAEYDGAHPIYIAKFLRPGIAYYTDIYGKELANDVAWKKALEKDEAAYYVITQAMFKQLSDSERSTLQIIVDRDDKVLLKKRGN
ncbi:MAG: arnT 3 [Firmicutes bacterium]|nr:arnT 3 [Bacillota bacterium]